MYADDSLLVFWFNTPLPQLRSEVAEVLDLYLIALKNAKRALKNQGF